MKFRIVEIETELANVKRVKVHTIVFEDNTESELERFYKKYIESNTNEVNFFMSTIEEISNIGIKEGFFKQQGGNSIFRFKNITTGKKTKPRLRLYCIKWGSACLIIGGGGIKPDDKRTWQEVPELKRLNEILSKIDNHLYVYNVNIEEACNNNITFEIED
ncbi:MAG: hypothetical protein AB2L26_00140 [Ignavibacteria bacterium]